MNGDVSQAAQDCFCDNESRDLLQMTRLLYTLNDIDHISNVKKMLFGQATLLRGSIWENYLHHSGERNYPRKLMLIWDTVAPYGLTPFRSDFIDYLKCDIPIKDATKINRIIGIGTNLQKLINSNGK